MVALFLDLDISNLSLSGISKKDPVCASHEAAGKRKNEAPPVDKA